MQSQGKDSFIQPVIGRSLPEALHAVHFPFHRRTEHGIKVNDIKALGLCVLQKMAEILMKEADTAKRFCEALLFLSVKEARPARPIS